MKKKDNGTQQHDHRADREKETNPPGYPLYPPSEDIYNQSQQAPNGNPEDLSKPKAPTKRGQDETRNEKDFNEDPSGSDLDIPGSELDDAQENVGSEDEENNYYSIGGDNHNDLEEDNQ